MIAALINVCLLVSVGLVRGDDVEELSSAASDLAWRLHANISSDKPNVVYSPYSIHSSLTMTMLGARGETADEMSRILGLTLLPGKRSHQGYHYLNHQLDDANEVTIRTINALYANPYVAMKSEFVGDARTYYHAKIANYDPKAPGGPEKEIDDYVESKTDKTIKEFLAKGTIDASTAALLVNALFFKGTWKQQFSVNNTNKEDFTKSDGTKTEVDMMNDERVVYIKNVSPDARVAELPFEGERVCLYLALPNTPGGFADLERSLAVPENLEQLFEGLTPRQALISIPSFKIDSSFELKEALQQLGMYTPFNNNTADFNGINDDNNIHISQVLHKAVIEVTEAGTNAAAATSTIGALSSRTLPSDTFKADHSFLFILRDKQTKSILFQGRFSG